LKWICWYSGLLCDIDWFRADILGLPVGFITSVLNQSMLLKNAENGRIYSKHLSCVLWGFHSVDVEDCSLMRSCVGRFWHCKRMFVSVNPATQCNIPEDQNRHHLICSRGIRQNACAGKFLSK
jgi:hypothetical protein